MRKTRVLHFIHSLSAGGAERQLCLLCTAMDKQRFDVGIFCVNAEASIELDERIRVYTADSPRLASPVFFRNLADSVRDFKPDIAHIWLPASVSIASLLVNKLLRCKTVFSFRNKMYFHRWLSYPEYMAALLFADRIVSNHGVEDSHRLFRNLYRLKKGRVIRNGVSVPSQYCRGGAAAAGVRRLLFVGRLTAQKNCLRLLQALARLRGRDDWRMDIYGEGEQRAQIAALLRERGLADRVRLCGFCDNIYREIHSADLLLFPSLYEGMPNVLVESMTIGTPVLASSIPANTGLIGDRPAVIWTDPGDAGDMAAKIAAFLDGEYDIDALVACGREIAGQFKLETMAREYEQFYTELG